MHIIAYLPRLGVYLGAIGQGRLRQNMHPSRSPDGVVLRLILVTVRAWICGVETILFFDQTGVPCFGYEYVFIPGGVRPYCLAPPAPRARQPHAMRDG